LLALLQARRHAELEAQAQAFLRRKPADGRVWHLLGLARMGLGHLSAAREALERARLFVPRDAAVLADLAVCLTALGERVAAADCFSRSLALQPGRADVCANAGRNALERGCYQEAEDFCRRALDLQPIAEAQYNLANALKAQGRAKDALAGYRKVLQLAPSVAEAHCAVAMGYLELGQPQEALACSLRALELKPGLVDAWVNLGSAYSQLGQFAEAEAAYGRALELNPAMAEAHNNLGNALWELGRPEDAIAAYRRALELRSAFAEAHNNLGNALRNLERLDEALEAYRRTIALQPGFVDAYYGAGEALTGLKRPDEAVVMLQRLVERAPGDKAYTRLGVALQAADRIEEAIAAYRHAIEVNSGFADAYYKLGDCLARAGRAHEAVAVLRSGMQHRPDDLDMHSALIFFLNYQDGVSPSMLLEEARRYGAACAARAEPFTSHDNTPDPARCVRVGLVSGDFGEHPVGHFLADVLPHLDAQEIELFVYETYKWKGELNTRLRASSSHWREAASKKVDDKALARLIREDGIDILVDLAGHTGNNRLPVFAWRPAPV
jgi:tetratricopeptide (TPR) repeat protein